MPQNNPNGMGINQQNMYQQFNNMNNNMPQNNIKGMGINYQQMFLQWINNNNFNNRNIQTLNMNNDGKNNNLKDIIFSDSSRVGIKIAVSGSETIENLLHFYGRKIGKERALERDFIFIHNATRMHLNDQRKIDEFFHQVFNVITVIEANFMVGGKKFIN